MINLIIDANKVINSLISPIVTCYANQYPKSKEEQDGKRIYPYATFKLPSGSPNNEFSDNYILQIDIWNNKGGDATEIETVTDAVFHALNKRKFETESLFMQIFRDTVFRISLPDPDINIQRRQLKFVVKIYEKEQ